MTSFDFWHRWLLVVSALLTLLGLVIAIFPDSFLFATHIAATGEVFFDGTVPPDSAELRSFLFAPIGGTIAGYFLLQTMIVWGPFRDREPWAWYAILGALLLWFVTDSTLSILHGALFNVWMVNIWTLLLVGLPLLMTRRAFQKTDKPS